MRLSDFFRNKSNMKYDWNKIRKRYMEVIDYELKYCEKMFKETNEDYWIDKYKAIEQAYNPTTNDMTLTNWIVDISIRASGKTTSWMILGLVMNELYGTIIQYVRDSRESITPKAISDMFGTFDKMHLWEFFTDGKFNGCYYWANSFRFAKLDENGNVNKDELGSEFCHTHSLDNSSNIKSTYSCEDGDLIIFDEFINIRYRGFEFVAMCDIFHTIARFRKEVWFILLANNLSPYNQYLMELGIDREVRRMKWGDRKLIQSGITPIMVEMIEPNELQRLQNNKELNINQFRFGMHNSKIASINGLTTWNLKQYPHLSREMIDDKPQSICFAYVRMSDCIIRLNVRYSDNFGYYVLCNYAKRIKENDIVYTLETPNPYEVKGIGYRNIDKRIWHLYDTHRFYYATNETGQVIDEYLTQARNLQR